MDKPLEFAIRLNLFAEHVGDLTLNGMFSHQLKFRVWFLFPHCDFSKRDKDRAVPKWILTRLLHAIQIVPAYVHKVLK
jgi:hypothetical protein